MNSFANNIAVGFLIGICFMATIVVALTILYFSNPKYKSRNDKKRIETSSKTKNSKGKNHPDNANGNILLRVAHFFRKNRNHNERPVQFLREELALNESGVSEKVTSEEQAPLSKTGVNKEAPLLSEDLSQASLFQPESDSTSNTLPAQAEPVIKEDPFSTTITNTPSAQAEPVPLAPPVKEKQTVEVPKSAEVIESEPATDPLPVVPDIKAVDENAEQDSADDNPKPENTSDDFSDLFTDTDVEDNDTSRLAKEFNDIDAQDILEDTQNLINQFRKTKH